MLSAVDQGTIQGDPYFEQSHGGKRRWAESGGFASQINTDRSFRRDKSYTDLERAASEEWSRASVSTYATASSAVPGNGQVDEEAGVASEQDAAEKPSGPVRPPKLTLSTKKELLQEVASDQSKLLGRLRADLESAGIQFLEVQVRFKDLHVEADVFSGSRAIPTLPNSVRNLTEALTIAVGITKSPKRNLTILRNVSGVLKAGRLTLLLGPPGSGKTSLLKALSGIKDTTIRVSGDITYNGYTFDEFAVQRTVAYVSQHDVHMPMMTVRETLQYSTAFQGGKRELVEIKQLLAKYEAGEVADPDSLVLAMMVQAEKRPRKAKMDQYFIVDIMMAIYGLDVCADTVVGDGMLRGISGGQKKRVTTTEMLVGPKKVAFLDEISTGLDSSTTYNIVKSNAVYCHIFRSTTLMSLLQPSPETYSLFDDVMLVSDGMIVYHGPMDRCLPFFEGLGFVCPPRKGAADFLQEVTSPKDQGQYWAGPSAHQWVPVQAMVDAFDRSTEGQARAADLASPVDREAGAGALTFGDYALTGYQSASVNMSREILFLKRQKFLMGFRVIQTAFMAIVVSFLFFRTELDTSDASDAGKLCSLQFFALLFTLMNSMTEMVLTINMLPVFYKQRDMNFYPGWSCGLPGTFTRLPASVLTTAVWSCIVYYMVGYSPNPARFFAYWFILLLVHCMATAMFRLLGAVGRTTTVATAVAVMTLLLLSLSSGFVLSSQYIPGWWIWMYWASPLNFAQRALAVNEFTSSQWDTPYPYGAPGQTIGQYTLTSRGFPTERYWTWVGFAVVFGYTVMFNLLLMLAFSYLSAYKGAPPTMSDEALQALEERRTGKRSSAKPIVVELTSAKLPDAAAAAAVAVKEVGKETGPAVVGVVSAGVAAVPAERSERDLEVGALANTSVASGVDEIAAPQDQEHQQSGASEPASAPSAAAAAASPSGPASSSSPSALPFTPMGLAFRDICYFVPTPAASGSECKELQLLHDISGAFRPGRLTALMGASGAGKTTLMDVLAGRKTGGRITGTVTVGGHPKEQKTFARVAGYVEQFDVHSPDVTVEESLTFSGQLRLPKEVNRATVMEYVHEVMELVELQPLAGSLVGLPGEDGLSVEQRKRLTIAVELVANPALVFMDEPTSGLDARAAAIVMRVVRRTVNTQRTVVCTIHQPSFEIFAAFDDLLLLKRGGFTIFNGKLGADACRLIKYFEAVPGVEPYNQDQNPANWMLDVSTTTQESKLGVDFGQRWADSDRNKEVLSEVESEQVPPPGSSPLSFADLYASSNSMQTKMLLWRLFKIYWRKPDYNLMRLLMSMLMALTVGTWYWAKGQSYDNATQIGNIMGALFLCVLFLGVVNANMVQPLISTERAVYYRERAAGTYAPMPYAICLHIVELPYLLVEAAIYSVLTYFTIRFAYSAAKFFWFFFYMLLCLTHFTFFGIMTVSITPNLMFCSVLGTFFYSLWNLFAGFIIPHPQMPAWLSWFWYINPVQWTLQGLIVSQLGDIDDQYVEVQGRKVPIGTYVNVAFGYSDIYTWLSSLILMAFICFWFFITVLALRRLNFQNR